MRIKKVRGVACERSGQPAPSHYSSPAVAPTIPCFTHKFSGKNSRPAKSVPHSRQRQKQAARERERWASCSTRIAAGPKSEKVSNCWNEQFLMKCFSNIVNWVSPEQASCCTRISGQTQFRKGYIENVLPPMFWLLASRFVPLYLYLFVCGCT